MIFGYIEWGKIPLISPYLPLSLGKLGLKKGLISKFLWRQQSSVSFTIVSAGKPEPNCVFVTVGLFKIGSRSYNCISRSL